MYVYICSCVYVYVYAVARPHVSTHPDTTRLRATTMTPIKIVTASSTAAGAAAAAAAAADRGKSPTSSRFCCATALPPNLSKIDGLAAHAFRCKSRSFRFCRTLPSDAACMKDSRKPSKESRVPRARGIRGFGISG